MSDKAREYCKIWIECAKRGIMAQEIPAYIYEETADIVGLDTFYSLTKHSKDKEIKALYDIGSAFLYRNIKNKIENAADDKSSTAQANLLKALGLEAGFAAKETTNTDDGQYYQLRLEKDGIVTDFMTKLGIFSSISSPTTTKPVTQYKPVTSNLVKDFGIEKVRERKRQENGDI